MSAEAKVDKERADTAVKETVKFTTLEKLSSNSAISLVETLGLAEQDEVSLQSLLKIIQTQVMASLEELTSITTHDSNMECQYKEVVAENTKLQNELEKARFEIRHLRGQLSIIQMSSSEVREEKARVQLRERKRLEQERLIELQRAKGHLTEEAIYVPSVADRARTVNSKGQYVDHKLSRSHSRHTRSSTYPAHQALPSISATNQGRYNDTLPPPLIGCGCSECNSKQTLGALTLGGRSLCQGHLTNQLTKSGQQILLGDKVVVKGERLGHVCYIGKLDFDFFDQIYIGIYLDMPVGNSNGTMKGRRYFQCPPSHGVFVKPGDVICVTGRKPLSGGTAVPRVREKVPLTLLKWPNEQQSAGDHNRVLTQQSLSSASPSSHSASTVLRAKAITLSELEALKHNNPYELVDISVREMTERMKALAQKQKSHDQAVATPTDEPDGVTPQGIPPQPLPPIIEDPPKLPTPGPTPPGSTPRPATPLEKTLLELLSDADLGATGFLKANELKAVLLKLGKIPPEGVTNLLTQVGVDVDDDAIGLPYYQLLPRLLPPLEQC